MTLENETQRLRIAIQKSGRLADDSLNLLKSCGVKLVRSRDSLLCRAENFPLDVLFVRDDDIPAFVASNVCQIGMVGQNVLREAQLIGKIAPDTIEIAEELSFGRCRLSLAGTEMVRTLQNGMKIATSYSGILRDWLQKNGIEAEIIPMSGAVEIAPRTGIADLICDLVSTGATLTANGLVEIEEIFSSQSVLIHNHQSTPAQSRILDRLHVRLQGVLRAASSKYIMLHCDRAQLDAIKKILPGAEDPTILPLHSNPDKVVVHAVCNENIFWDTMEQLRDKGASSILVTPIEKMLY